MFRAEDGGEVVRHDCSRWASQVQVNKDLNSLCDEMRSRSIDQIASLGLGRREVEEGMSTVS